MDSASRRRDAFEGTQYPFTSVLRLAGKLLSASIAVIASGFLSVASAADFEVHGRGHLCPDGAVLCGTANLKGYGNAEYRSLLIANAGPSKSCGVHSDHFHYDAIVTFTLADGSKLMLREAGRRCTPLYFFDARWRVVSATGQFVGAVGSGASKGYFAGAAGSKRMILRYDGALEKDFSDAAVSLGWGITLNGAPATCEAVGASRLQLLLSANSRTKKLEFDCDEQPAQSVVGAGDYSVRIDLVDKLGASMGEVQLGNVAFSAGYVTNIGTYTFAFSQ